MSEKLSVLYEDNSVVVAVKPFNMPVQSDSSGDIDLLTLVKAHIKEEYNKPGEAFIGLVHRLDRPAGGLVVFARNTKSASRLCAQVKSREMKRVYYAVVNGRPREKEERIINYLIKDPETNTVSVVPAATEGARQAVLDYKLINTVTVGNRELSLLQITLQTGRAHQIRVQMANMGCPLFGDHRYGGEEGKQQLALWAARLEFNHPIARDRRVFVCLPQNKVPWQLFENDIKNGGISI